MLNTAANRVAGIGVTGTNANVAIPIGKRKSNSISKPTGNIRG